MASFNKVILMGNLTRDPELRQTQAGTSLVKAGIAVNERIPDGQGGYREEAHFIDLTIWGKQAESFSRFFQKGKPVLIEGRLNYSTWEDKETGKKRNKLDVVVNRWHFVGGGREEGGAPSVPATAGQAEPEFPSRGEFVPDDVPF